MTALDDFLTRLEEVRSLLRFVAPEVDPEVSLADVEEIRRSRPFSDSTLSRSCTVLVVSYFEGFIKDLADEAFDAVLESGVPYSRFASHFRGYALSSYLDDLRASRGPSKDWEAMSALMEASFALSSKRAAEERYLPRSEVKRAVTSIEPAKINELFKVFGDGDLNRGPMSKFGERLRTLKSVRDNAVHGNEEDLTPLSLMDAIDYARLLEDCAKSMAVRLQELTTFA